MIEQPDIHEQLSAYLDGELNAAQAKQVERAVAQDPRLAAELHQLRAAREALRSLPREKVDDEFVARVLAQAERLQLVRQEEPREKVPHVLLWVRYAATAAVALIAVSVVGIIGVTLYSASKIDRSPVALSQIKQAQPERAERFFASKPASTDDRERRAGNMTASNELSAPTMTDGAVDNARSIAISNREELSKNGWRVANLSNVIASNGSLPGEMLASLTIDTDKLPETQREVEKTLYANGFTPTPSTVGGSGGGGAHGGREIVTKAGPPMAGPAIAIRNNTYNARQLNDEQIVYEIEADESVAPKIQAEINRLKVNQDQAGTLRLSKSNTGTLDESNVMAKGDYSGNVSINSGKIAEIGPIARQTGPAKQTDGVALEWKAARPAEKTGKDTLAKVSETSGSSQYLPPGAPGNIPISAPRKGGSQSAPAPAGAPADYKYTLKNESTITVSGDSKIIADSPVVLPTTQPAAPQGPRIAKELDDAVKAKERHKEVGLKEGPSEERVAQSEAAARGPAPATPTANKVDFDGYVHSQRAVLQPSDQVVPLPIAPQSNTYEQAKTGQQVQDAGISQMRQQNTAPNQQSHLSNNVKLQITLQYRPARTGDRLPLPGVPASGRPDPALTGQKAAGDAPSQVQTPLGGTIFTESREVPRPATQPSQPANQSTQSRPTASQPAP